MLIHPTPPFLCLCLFLSSKLLLGLLLKLRWTFFPTSFLHGCGNHYYSIMPTTHVILYSSDNHKNREKKIQFLHIFKYETLLISPSLSHNVSFFFLYYVKILQCLGLIASGPMKPKHNYVYALTVPFSSPTPFGVPVSPHWLIRALGVL